jgi:DNA-binding NtrC family response regulator
MPRSILVVAADPIERSNTVHILRDAGYRVSCAGNFEEGKQLLAEEQPDVLITDLRLGAYNGLHLILRSRADHPAMAAFITAPTADPVLAAEATRQNASFLVRPLTDGDLLTAIAGSSPCDSGPSLVT